MAKNTTLKKIGLSLRQARKDIGLSLGEAARKMEFDNYQTLSSIEKGERDVKAWEIAKFADIYHKSLEYLLGVEIAKPKPTFLWRNRNIAKNTKEIECKIEKYCEDYQNLEKLVEIKQSSFNLCLFNNRPTEYGEVAEKANDVCKILGLGSRPASTLADALEQGQGVKISYMDMGDVGSAVSNFNDKTGPAIAINRRDAPWRRNYDIAHELFHILTWKLYDIKEVHSVGQRKSQAEQFADYFASVLLLPEDALAKELEKYLTKKKLPFSACTSIAREFGVSTIALLWRLVSLRYISKNKIQEQKDADDLVSLDRKQRKDDWYTPPPKSPNFVALAFICLQQGLISRGRFAELMEINRSGISEFLEMYGLDETKEDVTEIITS